MKLDSALKEMSASYTTNKLLVMPPPPKLFFALIMPKTENVTTDMEVIRGGHGNSAKNELVQLMIKSILLGGAAGILLVLLCDLHF